MYIRPFDEERDADRLISWTKDRRAHAMWCADRLPYPLDRAGLAGALSALSESSGDRPFVAADESGNAVGFFCLSRGVKLKFIVIDPALRGRGLGGQMVRLALERAFLDPGADAVTLNVFSENAAAVRCYEALGFKRVKTEPGAFLFEDESWSRCTMQARRGE